MMSKIEDTNKLLDSSEKSIENKILELEDANREML